MQTRTYLCELGFDLYSHILSLTLFLAFIRAHSVVKYNVQFTTVHTYISRCAYTELTIAICPLRFIIVWLILCNVTKMEVSKP